MELLNATTRFMDNNGSETDKLVIQEALEMAILMLAPIVPHFCHSLWNHLGHDGAVMDATWPQVDESALAQDSMLIVLQVNGKLRSKIEVARDIERGELEKLALENESVKKFTEGATIRKVIVVPERLVNVVVS